MCCGTCQLLCDALPSKLARSQNNDTQKGGSFWFSLKTSDKLLVLPLPVQSVSLSLMSLCCCRFAAAATAPLVCRCFSLWLTLLWLLLMLCSLLRASASWLALNRVQGQSLDRYGKVARYGKTPLSLSLRRHSHGLAFLFLQDRCPDSLSLSLIVNTFHGFCQ